MGSTVKHNSGLMFFVALLGILACVAVALMGHLLGFHLMLSESQNERMKEEEEEEEEEEENEKKTKKQEKE